MTSSISLRAWRTWAFSSSFSRRLNVSSRWCSASSRCCMRASAACSVSRSRAARRCSCSSARISWSIFARCSASCASRALRFSRAAATTDGFNPRRPAISSARLRPGLAVDQLVGRREGLQLEAERRARHALGRRRVGLELIVVARGDHGGAAAAEVIDNRDAERAAFDRIGSRADFVEQDERGRHQPAIHRRDVGDVRRERAQARFDRLLVADIGEDAIGTPGSATPARRGCEARPASSSPAARRS